MSDYTQITENLTACIACHTPLVIVDSEERDRVRDAIASAARKLNVDVDFYTDCDQFVELRHGERTCDVGGDPLSFIEETLKKKSGNVFALGDVRFLDADNAFSRKLLGIVRLAATRKSTVIVVSPDRLWTRLNKLGMYLRLDLPTFEEREKLLREFMAENRIKAFDKLSQAAALLSGYSEIQLKTVLSYVGKLKGGFTYENLCLVATEKNKLFGSVPSVGKIEVGEVYVAGLENIKNWISVKEKIFFAPKEELDKKHLSPPKGVLLVGVPGCGKSLSAKLIAKSWRLPLYRFDIGALFDKYVGESEKNMREALAFIESVSPCVLWIDEIEKELSAGGDNDTAKRILGSFLYWLQEHNGRVFLVATANDVSSLPPELLRKGRFSEIFFVDLPGDEERKAAIELYAGLSLDMKLSAVQTDELAKASKGFSYADIEAAIKQVAEAEFIGGKNESYETLKNAFAATKGIMSTQRELIEKTRQWASDKKGG